MRTRLRVNAILVLEHVRIFIGETAGQTVFHAHVHLIPRRKGDVNEPRGGVRGVIPGKRIY